jgi:hypothetical protein
LNNGNTLTDFRKDKGPDIIPAPDQFLGAVGTDEAVGACYKDFHVFQVHLFMCFYCELTEVC